MNLIEIGPVIIAIWGVENGKLAVAVNNTLVRHMAFLAADCLIKKMKGFGKFLAMENWLPDIGIII